MKGYLKKQKNKIKWEKGTEELENFLYETELYDKAQQFSPYHFRITTEYCIMDIWAGVKKFYIRGTSGSACYTDINELKKYLLK